MSDGGTRRGRGRQEGKLRGVRLEQCSAPRAAQDSMRRPADAYSQRCFSSVPEYSRVLCSSASAPDFVMVPSQS